MSLPDFVTVDAYARKDGDLPQRFYCTPELESLSDCTLAVGALGTTRPVQLPVHTQILALRSGTLKELLSSTALEKNGSIPFFGHTLECVLIGLRFAYDDMAVTKDHIEYLGTRGILSESLRAVHALDLTCATVVCDIISKNLNTMPEIGNVFAAAHSFNDTKLMLSCYDAMHKWFRARRGRCSVSEAYHSVHAVRECPELVRSMAMMALCDDFIYEGCTLRRLFGSDAERLPAADYSWIIMPSQKTRLTGASRNAIHTCEFTYLNGTYQIGIRRDMNNEPQEHSDSDSEEDDLPGTYSVHVYSATGKPAQIMAFKLALIDMKTARVARDVECRGKCVSDAWESLGSKKFLTNQDFEEYSDEAGVVVIQLTFLCVL